MKGCKEGALTECLESTKEIKIDKNDQLAAMFTYINGKAYPLIPKGKNPERIPSDKCRKVPKRKYPEIPKVPGQNGKVSKYPEISKVPGKSEKVKKYPEIPKVPGKSGRVPKYPEIPKVERKRKKVKSVGDQAVKRAKLESPSEKEDVNETSTLTDTEETIELETARKTEQKLEMQKRTIFVSNIPTCTRKGDIKKIFLQYGKIDFVRLHSIKLSKKVAAKKTSRKKRKTLNANVRFECQDSAEAALMHKGDVYNGFHLRVCRDFGRTVMKQDNKRSVFVVNLPFETEEEDVWKHFSDCGEIECIRILRDKITGLGKGFGFVLFKSVDSVELAIQMNEASFLGGRKIHVEQAGSKKTTINASGNQIRTENGLEPCSTRTSGLNIQGLEVHEKESREEPCQ